MTNDIAKDAFLSLIFTEARTFQAWSDRPLADGILDKLYDLMKWGPTSANCMPARFVTVVSTEAKEKLASCAMGLNPDKIRKAPATVIVGYDARFHEHLQRLFPAPHVGQMIERFKADPILSDVTGLRNSALQGAYMIIAARALGLDCGPMSGFDNAKVDTLFFPGGRVKSNFICSLGYGERKALFPRGPRFAKAEVWQEI
jgi:3-hydroxypropanoate dehydrogenase